MVDGRCTKCGGWISSLGWGKKLLKQKREVNKKMDTTMQDNNVPMGTTPMQPAYGEWFKRLHDLRKEIDALIIKVKQEVSNRPISGGAEITLSYRSLQLAKMWLGKALEEGGSEFPKELADKAE